METFNNRALYYSTSYPAAMGEVVTQGHTDHCETYGHATHSTNGVLSPLCPRCGVSIPGKHDLREAWAFVVQSYETDGPQGHSPVRSEWSSLDILMFADQYHVSGSDAFLFIPAT